MNITWQVGDPQPCTDKGPTFGIAQGVRRHPQRCLKFWVLGLPLAGRISVAVGEQTVVADGGRYYLLPPGVPHRGTADGSADIAYFHFHCGKRGTRVALPTAGRRPRQVDYRSWFTFLRDASDAQTLTDVLFAGQLSAVVGQLAVETACAPIPSATRQVAEAVLDLLAARFAEELDAPRLVQLMGYSYGHLDRCFRLTYGSGIHARLVRIRIEAARAQLLHGRSVQSTAMACGFGDAGHFRKTFTRLVGVTPGRFCTSD